MNKILIILLILLIAYNMLGRGLCFPTFLCFLNKREGLTDDASNMVVKNSAEFSTLQDNLKRGISRLEKLSTQITQNKTKTMADRSVIRQTQILARVAKAKLEADKD